MIKVVRVRVKQNGASDDDSFSGGKKVQNYDPVKSFSKDGLEFGTNLRI